MNGPVSCDGVRRRLVADPSGARREADALHVGSCPDCRHFDERLADVRAGLASTDAAVEPDAGFAARVAARLDDPTPLALGWAATRLLPVALALVVVLAGVELLASREAPSPLRERPVAAPSDDVIAWVLATEGARR